METAAALSPGEPDGKEWLIFSATRHRLIHLQTAIPIYERAASKDGQSRELSATRGKAMRAELPLVEASYAKQKAALLAKLDPEKQKLLETELVQELEARALRDDYSRVRYPKTEPGQVRDKQADAEALKAVNKQIADKDKSLEAIRGQLSPDLVGFNPGPERTREMYDLAEEAGALKHGEDWPLRPRD